MNIQNIKNSTLAKLTAKEIGELGICNYGVGLYKGELKTRRAGVTRKSEDGVVFTFEYNVVRYEFIALPSTDEMYWEGKHWALRIFDKLAGKYTEYPTGIIGCEFIR